VLKEGTLSEIRLTIREGKFHQVKRMFETLGCNVVYLKRLSMGSLQLDETLEPGEYRPLHQEELEELKRHGKEKRTDHVK
jgi:16S rRNA pseudouridine516 synthase